MVTWWSTFGRGSETIDRILFLVVVLMVVGFAFALIAAWPVLAMFGMFLWALIN